MSAQFVSGGTDPTLRKYVAYGSRRFVIVSIALLVMLFPAVVRADGFYADIHGGATFFGSDGARVTNLTSGGSVRAHTNFDTGWLAGSSVGYEWAEGLAGEFEFTFRQNHLDRIASSSSLLAGGDLHSFAMMINGYYRFHNRTPFTPYIGGGLGEAVIAMNNARAVAGVRGATFGGTDATLAYQGIAGVSYPVAPRLSISAEYRYFGTLRPGFQHEVAGEEVKASPSYNCNNALVRLTYNFQ